MTEREIDSTEGAAEFPSVQYCVEVGASFDGPVVQVSFDGFLDGEHADYFARYILKMLELNAKGSPSGYMN
jgi:predicted secreted protein